MYPASKFINIIYASCFTHTGRPC